MPADPSSHPSGDDGRTGRDLLRAGQVTRALRLFEARAASTDADVACLAGLVECRVARGELVSAERAAEAMALTDRAGGLGSALASHALGELATAKGDHEAATARYTEAGEALPLFGDDPEQVPWRSGAAMALARLGRRRDAQLLAADQLAAARRSGSAYAVAHALRTMAATSADGGRLERLRKARTTLAGTRAERLKAQIDSDLAVELTLQGDPVARAEAVGLLRGAEAYAAREDLFPLQNRVRRLLERLDEQPRRIRSETIAVLTTTEQEVARMAAEGLTNREIADQLRVTVKAVEWHLSHVYRKLDIRRRSMLPASLGVREPAEVG